MLLFVVDGVFNVTGRGVILTPGILFYDEHTSIKTGTKVKIIKPDKSEVIAAITGIEWKTNKTNFHPILVGNKLIKEDVPIGSEVWLIKD